ncbi:MULTISPECIES: ATP-binding protein [unclassified Mameliella]|uniref:ATP-binding protein n=1 Tax=unclassified Mameliella TaxID=2630630 RepID=UPI00273EEC67|nr:MULTISPECIES: ATP-binding protein [unclassified Mameliella]
MTDTPDDRVSRARYERALKAQAEAEALLEQKSRDLFLANQKLSEYSADLEQAVLERTAELRSALEKAEAASTARSRFLATMSHEIRTPLGGLLGMIDLLSMDEEDPKKLELLNFAKTAGVGLGRIVNDVLDFSKMEAGVFLFEEENVDIRALIESIRILVASHEHGANRRIFARIDDSVPTLFLGDATRIRQVISNLVNNALRFSTDGPIIVRATARDHPEGALLRVEVEDFGVGIPESEVENLFKDFTQISNPLTAAAQGTGLGLAISKRIIKGIGGTISVTTTEGEGSTFWFEIPVRVVVRPEARGQNDPLPEAYDKTGDITGKKVLIAEDNIINQKLLLTYLDRMGLKADLAENGRIALEKFAPGKYDLVLMDVAMPEMDGLEATRRIRDKWSDAQIPPIMALTAHVMDAIEEEAKLVGIDRILSKPIPFEDLKSAIEVAMFPGVPNASLTNAPVTQPKSRPEADTREARSLVDLLSPDVHERLVDVFGLEGLSDFAGKFVKDSSSRIEALLAAERAGDHEEVSEQAHSLKGAAMAFGFSDMVEWARQIETGETHLNDETVEQTAAKFKAKLDDLDALLSG